MVLRYTKLPTVRQLRVAESIKEAVCEIFARNEPSFIFLEKIFVTVSEVRIAADLKLATIFVATIMSVDKVELISFLNDNLPQIKHLLAKKIHLKYVPMIRFMYDNSFDEGAKINALLHEIK